jgi:hypothetical protein
MPRLIDKLDAAVGLVPEFLDLGIDYLVRKPSPACLVGEDGTYNAGWYEAFDGALNVGDSMALDMAFQRWIHLSFDAGRYFVVCNIADFTRAGNVALLVANKESGQFQRESDSPILVKSRFSIDDDVRTFEDHKSHSFIRLSEDGARVEFSVHVGDLHFSGAARQALGPPFVQVSRFHRGRGCLQWFGCLALEHGVLSIGDRVIQLPENSLGCYDRTVGHQRGLQAWNWIAGSGVAVDEESGQRTEIGFQVACDRPAARPRVETHKSVVWVDGELHKVPSVEFEYQVLDPGKHSTTDWVVSSPQEGEGNSMLLVFKPRFHRAENRYLWLIHADFHQYYGEVTGRVQVGGRTWRLEPMFAVAEESLLEM